MLHGRHVFSILLTIAALSFAGSGCGPGQSEATDAGPSDQPDASDVAESDTSDNDPPDTGQLDSEAADTGVEAPDAASDTESTSPDADAGDAAASWGEVYCQNGVAPESVFEGTTRNPSTRVTIVIREDCGAVGSVATSTEDGNFNLSVRGSLAQDGGLVLEGRGDRKYASVNGSTNADYADVTLDAKFENREFVRQISLQRIE